MSDAWLLVVPLRSPAVPHFSAVVSTPSSKQRRYVLSIIPMPVIFAVTAAFTVVATRSTAHRPPTQLH